MEKDTKRITIKAGTMILSISLLAGCGMIHKNEVVINPDYVPNDEIEDDNIDETFDLEDKVLLVSFDDSRTVDDSIYTYDDLKHINSLIIRVDDDFNYDFLNYLTNMQFLHLDDYSSGHSLTNINGSNFQKNISLTITMNPKVGEFNSERYPFLRNIKSIKNLILGSEEVPLAIDDNYLSDLTNVHNLYVSINENSDIHFEDLEYLDYLYVDGDINYIDSGDIKELKEDGVKVKIKQ